jgi:hypothetical protein
MTNDKGKEVLQGQGKEKQPTQVEDLFYSAFTDKVERNYHFPAPGRNCYKKGKLILLFLWRDT